MRAGVDFPSFFEQDNYTVRHTTGHNMFDPESFITGEELEAGFTYSNSARNWDSENTYKAAVRGSIPVGVVALIAPRVLVANT